MSNLSYFEGVFEILELLNEDDHGREFYLMELELKNKTIEENLKELIGAACKILSKSVTNFKVQIEEIFRTYCQNYLYKIGKLNSANPSNNKIAVISKELNNPFIKKLFINSLIGFAQNSSKILEVESDENYNYGLPNTGFLIFKEQKCYFLHFAIT